ncbi:MAG: hypothetical protein JO345_04790 [Streptosporangiaceae bacterium]|nr:hypothetical protein [Streptosporangiaceae bacterium]
MTVIALRWNPEVKFSDVLTVIALVFTAMALAFTGYQVRQGRLASRQQFLFTTIDHYFRDPVARAFYYRVDYTEQEFSWKFDPDSFPGSPEEASLDYLLHTFCLIEQMLKVRVLSPRDVKILGFEALRVMENKEVLRYLEWLDKDYDEILGPNNQSYRDARDLARRFRDMHDDAGRSIVG